MSIKDRDNAHSLKAILLSSKPLSQGANSLHEDLPGNSRVIVHAQSQPLSFSWEVLSEAIEKHPAAFKEKTAFMDRRSSVLCDLLPFRNDHAVQNLLRIPEGSRLRPWWLFAAHVGGVVVPNVSEFSLL